jgi:hypothetical protein
VDAELASDLGARPAARRREQVEDGDRAVD